MSTRVLAFTLFAVTLAGYASADTIYDLRPSGTTVIINGATFTTDNTQPLGTGHSQFLGISGPTSRPQTEGYNTDPNSNMEFDTQPGTNTDPLALASLTTNGGDYLFLLDIDQTGANSFLSLDRLEIYLGNSSQLTHFQSGGATANTALPGSQTTGFGANSVLIYNLDATPAGPSAILLNFDNNLKGPGGSGVGDLLLRIPAAFFTPYAAQFPWVYLYSRFGDTADCLPDVDDGTCVNNGGPERWHAFTTSQNGSGGGGGGGGGGQTVPEPATLLLFAFGLLGVAQYRRRIDRLNG